MSTGIEGRKLQTIQQRYELLEKELNKPNTSDVAIIGLINEILFDIKNIADKQSISHLKCPLTKLSNVEIKFSPANVPEYVRLSLELDATLESITKKAEIPQGYLGGLKNENKDDCFMIALYQLLQCPFLREHFINELPEEVRNVFFENPPSSSKIRTVVADYTLEHLRTGMQDAQEVLGALFNLIGKKDAQPANRVSTEKPSQPEETQNTKKPQHVNEPGFFISLLIKIKNFVLKVFAYIRSFFCGKKEQPASKSNHSQKNEPTTSNSDPSPPPKHDGFIDLTKKLMTEAKNPLFSHFTNTFEYVIDPDVPEAIRNSERFGGPTHQSNKQVNNPYLTLQFPNDSSTSFTLKEMLDHFMKEQIEEVEAVIAKDGTNYPTHQRKETLKLKRAPECLLLHFSRFEFSLTGQAKKRNEPISGISEQITLDENYFQTPPAENQRSYELKALVQHSGGTGGGHYTAYRKVGDDWYYFNDSVHTKVTTEHVLKESEKSYLVFYEKVN